MKILRWIIIVLILMIAAFFIFSATQPNVLLIKREIKIDASPELVYQKLINFNTWKDWTAYHEIDSNLTSSTSGAIGEIGSSYRWKSDKPVVGEGVRVLVEKQPNKYLKHKINLKGWKNNSQDEFKLKKTANGSVIIRRYEGGKTPFYLNFLNTFMEPMVKSNLKKDLQNFKAYVENIEAQKIPNPHDLEVQLFEGVKYISITDTCRESELSQTLSNLYTKLSIYFELNDNAKEAGSPIAIYHRRNKQKMIVEAALPYQGEIKASDPIKIDSIAASEVIRGKYYGEHQMSGEIYDAIKTYAEAKSWQLKSPPWESYMSMSANNNNTEAFIYYPIQSKK